MSLYLCPTTLAEANAFVASNHRHHKPVPGCKFVTAVASATDDAVKGVAIVGRPVARHLDDGRTLEINRLCTDGSSNAASMLLGACRRAAWALGYKKLVTYTLVSEPGHSLRAAGFRLVAEVKGRSWSTPSRPRIDTHPLQNKLRWEA